MLRFTRFHDCPPIYGQDADLFCLAWSVRQIKIYLTLVRSLVPLLKIPNLKGPVVRVFGADDTKALVAAVGAQARGEDVVVASPDPRHLVVNKGSLLLRHLDVTDVDTVTLAIYYAQVIFFKGECRDTE